MRNSLNIYLSGGMTGLSVEEQTRWRREVIEEINKEVGDEIEVLFFNPPDVCIPLFEQHGSEKEIMEYDIYRLRKSDIIIVGFNAPNSIGTAMELILAREWNKPVIGLNEDNNVLHPWVDECCSWVFNDIRDIAKYISRYYI